jgi:multidrug resistance efflux pump
MSDHLPPIPTPPSRLWRQMRLQYLPILVFILAIIAAVMIWTKWVAPPTLVAEAEAIRSEVRSAHTGTLVNVKVGLLQPVKAGETIGQIVRTDPKLIEASLAVIRAELDVIRFTMNPVLGQQRAALDYERLLLDLMKARVDLAALRAQLFQAQSTFERTSTLFASKLVTEERYEEVKNARDSLDAQVKAQSELIARIEPGLTKFSSDNGPLPSPEQGLRAAIAVQEGKLRLTEAQLGPISLVAPIDGVVSAAYRQSGETVPAGEPIFQISAVRSERVIGFLRQPFSAVPKPGSDVEIRTRTLQRHSAHATIAQVGSQLEPITPTLLTAMRLPVSSIAPEFGLRVHVTAPAELALRPGEQVDVIIRE